MSYSFSITADSKDEAGEKVEEQLSAVVQNQPVHELDRQTAQNAAVSSVSFLIEPSEQEQIQVSVSGYLGWRSEGPKDFTSANVSVTASIVPRPVA